MQGTDEKCDLLTLPIVVGVRQGHPVHEKSSVKTTTTANILMLCSVNCDGGLEITLHTYLADGYNGDKVGKVKVPCV